MRRGAKHHPQRGLRRPAQTPHSVGNTCYSSSLYESTVSLYSHYAIAVKHIRGMWDGSEYNEVIAKVRRDGDLSAVHPHYFVGPVRHLHVRVLAVKKDGAISQYVSPEIWSLGLEIL